jgi:hypothetical protein
MLNELSGRGAKFEWAQEKTEKIEKKYKDYIATKWRKMQKDSLRDIRTKLLHFSKVYR